MTHHLVEEGTVVRLSRLAGSWTPVAMRLSRNLDVVLIFFTAIFYFLASFQWFNLHAVLAHIYSVIAARVLFVVFTLHLIVFYYGRPM